jgi:hypothetical protein
MKKVFMLIILSILLTACGNKTMQIEDAWARTGSTGSTSSVYLTINNPLEQDDVLLSAKANAAETVELHRSTMSDTGMMMMQQEENIPIPAKTTVKLEPGGLHIMLFKLNQDLIAGNNVTLDVPVRTP